MAISRWGGRIRARVEYFLSDTCTIEREVAAYDKYGSPTRAWKTIASGVKCRVISAGEASRGEMESSGVRETMTERYRLICPVGTELGVDYRVTVSGKTYHVVSLIDAWTDAMDTQAIIERRNDG